MASYRSNLAVVRDGLLQMYCWCLILTALYVLSIGPMFEMWYDASYLGRNRAIVIFYYPLSTACEYFRPLHDWVHWYVGMWIS